MTEQEYAEILVANWDGPFVRRRDTDKFTNGAVSHRSIANDESKGDPVPGRAMVGRSVIFPTRRFAKWLARRYFKG